MSGGALGDTLFLSSLSVMQRQKQKKQETEEEEERR
jgi:hypothetical protein